MADKPEIQTPAPAAELSLAEYRETRAAKAEAAPVEKTDEAGADALAGTSGETAETQDKKTERPAVEPAEDEDEEERPKKKGGFQRKIERLSDENEELRRQLAEKSAAKPAEGAEAAKPVAPELPAFDKAKPKLEEFDSIEGFTEALTEWKLDKREFEREQRETQQKADQQTQEVFAGWQDRVATAKTAHADYDDVLAEVADVKIPALHGRLLIEDERGAELAYLLAQDRAQLENFVSLPPLQAAKALERFARQLEDKTAPKQETKRVSAAPPPLRPVGARTAPATIDPASATLGDYRRAREAGKLR